RCVHYLPTRRSSDLGVVQHGGELVGEPLQLLGGESQAGQLGHLGDLGGRESFGHGRTSLPTAQAVTRSTNSRVRSTMRSRSWSRSEEHTSELQSREN